MSDHISDGIEQAFFERTDLLVVALTGRTGSGCTTTANILCKAYAEISISPDEFDEPERRKLKIAYNFCAKQWLPFESISVSTVILGFLLDNPVNDISEFLKQNNAKNLDKVVLEIQKIISTQNYSSFKECIINGDKTKSGQAWRFYNDQLKLSATTIRGLLASTYAPIFQLLGDNIRLSGSALSKKIDSSKLFELIRSVKRLAKAAFTYNRQANKRKSTRIVIDAVRNPLELVYLRDQFSAFYAIAITTNDEDRRKRLEDRLNLSRKEISSIDDKEYPEDRKHLDDYQNFVSQNIQDCIQKSDIFFENPGTPAEYQEKVRLLNAQVIRYTALMLRPGLITPTRDERCMQLAFVAKLNSGCISRQVGAAVADSNFSIKSVGWNDVPKGQVPCLLREVDELLTGGDKHAFSHYEKTETPFKSQVGKTYSNRGQLKNIGLPCPFCFKREYNILKNKDNQVHTRSLHAEENAFLQLAKHGNSGIDGGYLFTTASPCELCSKKAFQLGITEVVFVDPYPGISSSHILSSGDERLRPKLRLFRGAIGHAYHRLYDPMLPIKDEYLARLSANPQRNLL